jgi:hypothetical protein
MALGLLKLDQGHLFSSWSDEHYDQLEKHLFWQQLFRLNALYPGGLMHYIKKSKGLLDSYLDMNSSTRSLTSSSTLSNTSSKSLTASRRSLLECHPHWLLEYAASVPQGVRLDFGNKAWQKYELEGRQQLEHCCFVVDAGGSADPPHFRYLTFLSKTARFKKIYLHFSSNTLCVIFAAAPR